MVKYRNVVHGRVVERPAPDEWLEKSAGWDRVEDVPAPQASADEQNEEE